MRTMRLSAVAVMATALLLVAACSPETSALGEKDAGRTVELAAGRTLTVRLPSNATTGFQWVVAETGPLEQQGEAVYEEPKSDALGAGGTQTFTFKAGDSGSGELQLAYRRSWETTVPPEKTWAVTIAVK